MKKGNVHIPIVILVLVIGGYFLMQLYQKKNIAMLLEEERIDNFESTIASKCENGEWVEFPAYSKKGDYAEYKAENERLKLATDENITNTDESISFITDENYSLSYFVEKDASLEGINIGTSEKKQVYVKKIKCTGIEANKDIRDKRQKIMNYINSNIDSIAPEKSATSTWQIATFYFVNDTDLYVEYESPESVVGDAPYDARLWLVRIAKLDAAVPSIESLAYIQEDAEDPDKNVIKSGNDLYKNTENMIIYEYDDDLKQWTLQ